jgi:hypothetical protein
MQKNINLSIPKPCSEKWENFTPSYHGGFCNSCNKMVVDFTKKSDEEIIDFFKSKPTHACGRFRPDQLRPYLDTTSFKITPGFGLIKASLLSLLFMLVNKPASAQTTTDKPKTEVINRADPFTKSSPVSEEEFVIKGMVMAQEDDSPLPGVNVILKGTTIETTTDADGRFEFPKKLKEDDVLVFCFIGLQTTEYSVRKLEKDKAEIKMITLVLDLTGEVAVNEVYTSPNGLRKFWTKVKGLF